MSFVVTVIVASFIIAAGINEGLVSVSRQLSRIAAVMEGKNEQC